MERRGSVENFFVFRIACMKSSWKLSVRRKVEAR